MKSLRTSSTPEFRPAGRVLAGTAPAHPALRRAQPLPGLHHPLPRPGAPGPPGPAGGLGGGADHPVRPAAPHLRLPAGRNGSGGLRGGDPERPEQSPGRPQHHRGQLGGGPDGGAVLRSLSPVGDPHSPGRLSGCLPGGAAGAAHRRAHRGQPHHPGAGGGGGVQHFQRGHRRPGHLFPPMRCSAIPTSASAG